MRARASGSMRALRRTTRRGEPAAVRCPRAAGRSMRNERFGALLSEGLSSVAKRHQKTLGAVDAEIVRELRLKAWTVHGWRRGYVPRQAEQIAFLAR